MEGCTTYSPARGRSVEPKQVEQIQHKNIKRQHTVTYIALYYVVRQQGTLVDPRLWAEEVVGRAKLNKHVKPTFLRLR